MSHWVKESTKKESSFSGYEMNTPNFRDLAARFDVQEVAAIALSGFKAICLPRATWFIIQLIRSILRRFSQLPKAKALGM